MKACIVKLTWENDPTPMYNIITSMLKMIHITPQKAYYRKEDRKSKSCLLGFLYKYKHAVQKYDQRY